MAATTAPEIERNDSEGTGTGATAAGVEPSHRRGRRRKDIRAASTGHGMPAGISDGKYDLQCFLCLQRPPTHTAFVYVSELMR